MDNEYCDHFDCIFLILAGYKDNHKILNEFQSKQNQPQTVEFTALESL